jgi:hypothetical protein
MNDDDYYDFNFDFDNYDSREYDIKTLVEHGLTKYEAIDFYNMLQKLVFSDQELEDYNEYYFDGGVGFVEALIALKS